jgi:hypothetical protein
MLKAIPSQTLRSSGSLVVRNKKRQEQKSLPRTYNLAEKN